MMNLKPRIDPEVKNKLGEHWSLQYDDVAWRTFSRLSMIVFSITRIGSQLFMVVSLFNKNSGDPIFLAACITIPIINYLVEASAVDGLWNKREF